MYRGTVVWALNQVSRYVDDRNSDGSLALSISSTTSVTKRARAVDALNEAQISLFYWLLDNDVDRNVLSREFALTAISGATSEYQLPPRMVELHSVRDSAMDTDDAFYPAMTGTDYGDYGYTIEDRGTRLKWHNFQPDSSRTYYARIIQEPPPLAYGGFLQAETSSTTGLLGDTAEYGMLELGSNDLIGSYMVIESATTGAGTERRITASSNSGSTTTITVNSAWTFTDDAKWSTAMSLPQNTWNLVTLIAAANVARWTMPSRAEDIERRALMERDSILQAARQMAGDGYPKTRIVRSFAG